jgi:hypothetical protein
MRNLKTILRGIDTRRKQILKFFITCAVLEFFISTLYRIVQVKDSRTQIESIINIYSLLLAGMIFLHEISECLIPKILTENFKMITHYPGKGILFIIVSFIYFSPTLGVQQNYSAYLLFFVGLICLFADCRKENSLEEVGMNNMNSDIEMPVETKTGVDKQFNPYDIPDDF